MQALLAVLLVLLHVLGPAMHGLTHVRDERRVPWLPLAGRPTLHAGDPASQPATIAGEGEALDDDPCALCDTLRGGRELDAAPTAPRPMPVACVARVELSAIAAPVLPRHWRWSFARPPPLLLV